MLVILRDSSPLHTVQSVISSGEDKLQQEVLNPCAVDLFILPEGVGESLYSIFGQAVSSADERQPA